MPKLPCTVRLPPKGWWQEENDIGPRLKEILPVYDGDAAPVTLEG